MIDISGLDKAAVLAVLFNGAKQQGRGFLNTRGQADIAPEQAREIIAEYKGDLYFDYLQGRVMKTDLNGDALDPWGYDRDNGEGAAERAIKTLRG